MINKHYFNRYLKFINDCDSQDLDEKEITQVHHIIPKCFGGSDDKNNLITLRFREHQIAHKLLSLAYPECPSLKFASNMMSGQFPMVGETNPFWRRTHTSESREKISAAHNGKKRSEETKKRMSAAHIGKKLSEETKKRMSAAKLNMSEETKKKISVSLIGKKKSDEHKAKISAAKISKTIYTFIFKDEVIVDSTQYDLRKKYNLNQSALSMVCSGKKNIHKGWKLYKEVS